MKFCSFFKFPLKNEIKTKARAIVSLKKKKEKKT
jgi:hypothetical protein